MHTDPDALDVMPSRDAVVELDCNRSTLTRWVEAGRITPAFRMPGRHGAFVFHRADVARLKAEIAAERRAAAERVSA